VSLFVKKTKSESCKLKGVAERQVGMIMDDTQYFDLVEEIFNHIEDQIDELEFDLDIDVSGGILTVAFPDGSSVVLSKQVATHEIWVAARSGGYHLQNQQDTWHCTTTGENLTVMLNRIFTEQLGVEVAL